MNRYQPINADEAARSDIGPDSTTSMTETTAELQTRIREHLKQYPGLTAFAIARALRLSTVAGNGQTKVRTLLRQMEAAGEAVCETGPREPGDSRFTHRWRMT